MEEHIASCGRLASTVGSKVSQWYTPVYKWAKSPTQNSNDGINKSFWPKNMFVLKGYHPVCINVSSLFKNNLKIEICYYTPASTKLKWIILVLPFPSVPLSIRPSVHLWTESCPLCIFNNTCWIHFILTHLIKLLKKVCYITETKTFGKFFKFVTLTLSCFDLGSKMN